MFDKKNYLKNLKKIYIHIENFYTIICNYSQWYICIYNRAVQSNCSIRAKSCERNAEFTHHVIRISQVEYGGKQREDEWYHKRLFFSFVNISLFPKCIRASDLLGKYFVFLSYTFPWTAERVSHKFTGSVDCDLLSEWKLFLRPCCTYVAAPTVTNTSDSSWCPKNSMLPSRISWYTTAHFRSFAPLSDISLLLMHLHSSWYFCFCLKPKQSCRPIRVRLSSDWINLTTNQSFYQIFFCDHLLVISHSFLNFLIMTKFIC